MRDMMTLLYHDVYRIRPAESGFQDTSARGYKLSEQQFADHLSAISAATDEAPVLIGESSSLARHKSPFGITVDDGGISYHSIVANALENLGWRGYCFVTTGQIGERGFLEKGHIRDLYERGHVIGTHTVSHPDRFSDCDWPVLLSEWRSSKACLEDVIGGEVTMGSVPGGDCSPRVINAALDAGLNVLFTAEPEARIRRVADMLVVGRFVIRKSMPATAVGRLVRRRSIPMMQAWLDWKGKKILNRALGPNYRGLSR